MVSPVIERGNRPLPPSVTKKEAQSQPALQKERGVSPEVKTIAEALPAVATIVAKKAVLPDNPQVDESYRKAIEDKAVGTLPDPNTPQISEKMMAHEKELTDVFVKSLQEEMTKLKQQNHPIDTQAFALTLAQLKDPSIVSLDTAMSADADPKMRAAATLAYDAVIKARGENGNFTPEQAEKEKTIQEEAKALNEKNLYYFTLGMGHTSGAFHVEKAFDNQGRPYQKICDNHANENANNFKSIAEQLQNVKPNPPISPTLPQRPLLPVPATSIKAQVRLLPGLPHQMKDTFASKVPLPTVGKSSEKQGRGTSTPRSSADKQPSKSKAGGSILDVAKRIVNKPEGGQHKQRKQEEADSGKRTGVKTRESGKDTPVRAEKKGNSEQGRVKKVAVSLVAKVFPKVPSEKGKEPQPDKKPVTPTKREKEGGRQPIPTNSIPGEKPKGDPKPKTFGSEQKITVEVNIAEPVKVKTGEAVARAIETVQQRQEQAEAEEVLVQTIAQESKKQAVQITTQETRTEEKRQTKAVKQEKQETGDVERLLSEQGVVQHNPTPNTPSDPALKRKAKKNQTQAISNLSVAASLPGSLDSQQHIREVVLATVKQKGKKPRLVVRPLIPKKLPPEITATLLEDVLQTAKPLLKTAIYVGWTKTKVEGKRVTQLIVATGDTTKEAKQRFKKSQKFGEEVWIVENNAQLAT